MKGKSLDDALKVTNKAVMEALDGLPPVKVHCSVLAEQAIRSAIADYYTKEGVNAEAIIGKLPDCSCEYSNCSCDLD